MNRAKLVWLTLTLAAALLYVATDLSSKGLLLVATLLWGALAFLASRVTGKRLTITLTAESEAAKNQLVGAQITVTNQSRLAVMRLELPVTMENLLTGESWQHTLAISMLPKQEKAVPMQAGDVSCGVLRLALERPKVADSLGLFGRVLSGLEAEATITIFPDMEILPLSQDDVERYDMESYRFAEGRTGNDPSETVGIREYQPGDSIKAIHWKLSSKMGDVQIREHGLPIESSVLVLADRAIHSEEELPAERMDEAIELFASVCNTLIKQGIAHATGWYDYRQACWQTWSIQTEDDCYRMLEAALCSPFRPDQLTTTDRFLSADAEKQYASILYITFSLEAEREMERLGEHGEVHVYRPENFKS